jgi:hypothetical protein
MPRPATCRGRNPAPSSTSFWYFNIFEQAILRVRHCPGDCTGSAGFTALVTPL